MPPDASIMRADSVKRTVIRWPSAGLLLTGIGFMLAVMTAEASTGPEMSAPTTTSRAEQAPMNETSAVTPTGVISTAPTTTIPVPRDTDIVDTVHEGISYGFLSSAVWLDSFFGDERYESESKLSRVKISFQRLYEEGTWTRYRPDYQLRLVLPQLRRLTKLLITTDLRDDVDNASVLSGVSAPPKTEDRAMTTALQYFLRSTAKQSTSLRGGMRYHAGQIEYFVGPRYRYYQTLDSWGFRFTQDVVWGSEKGWKANTWLDLERPLPRDLFFRTTLSGEWTESVHGYLYYLGFLVRQPLDPDRAVQYEMVNSFRTRPMEELTEVKFIFRYRQRFWKDWLFMEIAPQYRYPRDHSFNAVPGILFKVEVVFGEYRSFF
jgi:hypothetical protein